MLLQDSITHERRPLGIHLEQNVYQPIMPAQRETKNASRIAVTNLRSPDNIE